ncbi:unnamed protein product [Microthlaspi erraticum]|uniref:SUI1 domain-containing protein n=1 Tax=Microthlaspi erraticum TaxID=1685480 RepID=A0A6D2IIU6_9BRAS|nr:unnamed protein product [Microthlaspi erraticum]
MYRHASSGVYFAPILLARFSSSLSKISSASNRSVRFRVCSAATRWSHGVNWRSLPSLRAQTRIDALVLEKFERKFATIASEHAYKDILTTLHKPDGGEYGKFYSLPALNDPRIDRLPYSVRILLESAIRNCDNFHITKDDVEKIIDWENTSLKKFEIPFKPARVILQDFTGVSIIVDLAAMRDAMKNLGSDPNKINPRVPVDLVFDHSVKVYGAARPEKDLGKGVQLESDRNWERFMFLKWASSAFHNIVMSSNESPIVHQEYLGRVVFNSNGFLYPDSVVGTTSNTRVIDGLGVVGLEVGGMEAEAAILGQPISMVLPSVVGVKLVGKLRTGVTLTNLVPTVTQMLRKHGVFGNFVEFYGEGMSELSVDDRAMIASMSHEYEATMGFFPVDPVTIEYLKLKGRSNETVKMIESYLRANKMFVDYNEAQEERAYTSCLQLDLGDVEPCISGPRRPCDQVVLKHVKADWKACLNNPLGFKGTFAVPNEQQEKTVKFLFHGEPSEIKHGSVVIANITSDSTTSSHNDMVAAALVAKKAYDLGLEVKPWVRTAVSPVSGLVEEYLLQSGLKKYLARQGFNVVGYGVKTSIRGSDGLDDPIVSAILENDIVTAAVLSNRRGFDLRVHALVNIDFEKESMGTDKDGKNVYLRDIWPSREEVSQAIHNSVLQSMFKSIYETTTKRNPLSPSSTLYSWDSNSTFLQEPPFFKNMNTKPQQERSYTSCLQLDLGDIEPYICGPKRPCDRVLLKDMKADWKACLGNPLGIKGFAIPEDEQDKTAKFSYMGQPAELKHGSVVIATITTDNNISCPSHIVMAALVAKKAYDIGFKVKPWVRTSVAPGYGVVKEYLLQSGLQEYLDKKGFQIVGHGFTTCIWGSGELDESIASAISENDLVAAVVHSSCRSYESRVHASVKANYLASPPLVVAYALAGTVNIDFEIEPMGTDKDGKNQAIIAKSFDRVHRSNLASIGIVPLCFKSAFFSSLSSSIEITNPKRLRSSSSSPIFRENRTILPQAIDKVYMVELDIQIPAAYDPFAEAKDSDAPGTKEYIHIRIQQRNGKKSLTTVQGLRKEFSYERILKDLKKDFCCNGNVVQDKELGKIIQLQGDQRKKVSQFLVQSGIAQKDQIKIHGF